jgi:hypothetical protein
MKKLNLVTTIEDLTKQLISLNSDNKMLLARLDILQDKVFELKSIIQEKEASNGI